jgi:hypothetical protein
MKISISNNNKLVRITVRRFDGEGIVVKEQLFRILLLEILDSKSITLVTITPQGYSLAHDFIPNELRRVKNMFFLINKIDSFDLEIATQVSCSEEFARTLMIIVRTKKPLSDRELDEIEDFLQNKIAHINSEIIFCEDDGDSFCLYNINITLSELKSILDALPFNMKLDIDVDG